ncbi:MAG: diadenylate cyclase [Firmicutes bacterium]|nr:diadenylate cyclase [Bacillota bacterium]
MFENFFYTFANNLRNRLSGGYLVVSIIDMVVTALLLYLVFAFLKKNNSTRLIKFILLFVIVALVFTLFNFSVLGAVFSQWAIIALILVLVVFPQEMRRGIYRLASPPDEEMVFESGIPERELRSACEAIVKATLNMAKKNTGALIVICPDDIPMHLAENGTRLGAKISSGLIESIFNTQSPLHDGAMFIKHTKILSAGCFLPLSQSSTLDKELGTRHRAAIGVSESYNVFCITVSEETGVISTAQGGELIRYYDSAMLTDKLEQVFGLKVVATRKRRK